MNPSNSYKPGARWPAKEQLEYIQRFATVLLLVGGLILLSVYFVRNPRGAIGRVGRAAEGAAGAS